MNTKGKARQPEATGAGLECNHTADHTLFSESIKKKIEARAKANQGTRTDLSHISEKSAPALDRYKEIAKIAGSSHDSVSKVACRVWALDYSLEMARQKYADRRQVWRQAGVCVLIGVLRFAGVA